MREFSVLKKFIIFPRLFLILVVFYGIFKKTTNKHGLIGYFNTEKVHRSSKLISHNWNIWPNSHKNSNKHGHMREFSVLKASIIFPSLYPTIDVFYRIVKKTHISMDIWGNFQYWKSSSYFQGYFWFLSYFTGYSKKPQISMDL